MGVLEPRFEFQSGADQPIDPDVAGPDEGNQQGELTAEPQTRHPERQRERGVWTTLYERLPRREPAR